MNSEHHMERMSHPAPRFEIVHKPRVMAAPYHEPPAVVNPQPWSVRFIGGNGEQVWRTSESYSDVRDAERAIALLAEALGSEALVAGKAPVREMRRPAEVPVVRVEVGP